MKKLFCPVLALVFLGGCAKAPIRFDGPGDFQEFSRTRYQCARETVVPRSAGALPSCDGFRACLAAHGYNRAPAGKLDASPIALECWGTTGPL